MKLVFPYSTVQNSIKQSIITISCNALNVTLNCSAKSATYSALNTHSAVQSAYWVTVAVKEVTTDTVGYCSC